MRSKPAKPYPNFPLTPHPKGRWCKKIKGKIHYFGTWEDPDLALREYQSLIGGLSTPPEPLGGPLTLYNACQLFLDSKDQKRASGEASARTYQDYVRTLKRLCGFLGKDRAIQTLTPQDFAAYRAWMSEKWNVVSVGNEVTRVKAMLNWLEGEKITGKIDTGKDFKKPSRRSARKYRKSRGKKMFSPQEIQRILDEAGVHLHAMILLGINGGFQNADCEELPLEVAIAAVKTGWIDFPRTKTEVDRRFPLWKTTRRALRRSISRRVKSPLPNAFILPNGRPYSSVNCDVSKRFRAARDHAFIQEGGFSWLRKTFATVASACGDQVAVDYCMGHVDPSIGEVYRQDMQDERLQLAVRTVWKWLYR